MPRRLASLLTAVTLGLLLGWGSHPTAALRAEPGPGWPAVSVEFITDQLDEPVFVTHAGDGSGRLFGVEKKGRIVILRDGVPAPTPFLDISSQIMWDQFKRKVGGLLSV